MRIDRFVPLLRTSEYTGSDRFCTVRWTRYFALSPLVLLLLPATCGGGCCIPSALACSEEDGDAAGIVDVEDEDEDAEDAGIAFECCSGMRGGVVAIHRRREEDEEEGCCSDARMQLHTVEALLRRSSCWAARCIFSVSPCVLVAKRGANVIYLSTRIEEDEEARKKMVSEPTLDYARVHCYYSYSIRFSL